MGYTLLPNRSYKSVIRKPKDNKRFTKTYAGAVKCLTDEKVLTDDECAFLFKIMPYCEMNTNFLVHRQDKEIVPMVTEDILKFINKSERYAKALLKNLMRKNILCQNDSGDCAKYCLNPELYWNGSNGHEKLIHQRMFYTKQKEKIQEAKSQLRMSKVYINGRASSFLKEAQRIAKVDNP